MRDRASSSAAAAALRAGDAAERGADAHADAGRVALAEHVAGHHFAGHEQVGAGRAAEVHRRASRRPSRPEVGEGDARPQRVAVERRRVDRPRPVRLGRREAFGAAVVEHGVVEACRRGRRRCSASSVCMKRRRSSPSCARQLRQRVGLRRRETPAA